MPVESPARRQEGRKRQILTCMPCHARKQKCDRQRPCNHCTRRRKPDECIFNPKPADRSSCASSPMNAAPTLVLDSARSFKELTSIQETQSCPKTMPNVVASTNDKHSAIAKSFGYFEDSNTNTMALLRKWEFPHGAKAGTTSVDLCPEVSATIKKDFGRMPHRQVLDFLVQYFLQELNWIKQVIYPLSFLTDYQQWYTNDTFISVANVEFTVLILRICSYAAHLLPSPSHTIEGIQGLSLSEIRSTCSDVADSLTETCIALDWKGSPVRVQHIIFAALKFSCEGRADQFWEQVAGACQAAQKAGLHIDGPNSANICVEDPQSEARRRTFCSLYVLDSRLSRQLDRVPFLPDDLIAEILPRLHFSLDTGGTGIGTNAPKAFTERLMQAQLGRFWRRFRSSPSSEYDPVEREDRYEKFCAEYLPSITPEFALEPDTRWDKSIPKLSMQRQLLHIAIFDSVCWNFRSLILLDPIQVARLPLYKQVLLQSQKKRLAMAVLKELETITTLHSLFGGSHTRLFAIVFNTFEAVVLLLSLCSHEEFPFDQGGDSEELLGLKLRPWTREASLQEAEIALARLQMLAEVSGMAASGAQVVTQLLFKTKCGKGPHNSTIPAGSSPTPSWMNLLWTSQEHLDATTITDWLSTLSHEYSPSALQIPARDSNNTL